MKKILLAFTLLVLCAVVKPLAAQNLPRQLEEAIRQKRANVYFDGLLPFVNHAGFATHDFLQRLRVYEKDTSEAVRNFTCELYAAVYAKSTNKATGQFAVERLCTALSDTVPYIRSTAASALQEIPREVFSDKIKSLIIESLSAAGEPDEDQLLLTGYLDLSGAAGKLRQWKDDPTQDNRIRWCCYLALSRMNDNAALNFILTAVRKQGVNDRAVYHYFPDLVYTRRREALDYLVNELYNDTKNCSSPNPDLSKALVCGYRIMEMLAPVIKDFPLKITAAGNIDASDYDKALDTARKWFRQHRTDYVIITDTF